MRPRPYPILEERAFIVPNTIDPLLPPALRKYELRTRIEGFSDMPEDMKVQSSRGVFMIARQMPVPLAVLVLSAKNIVANVIPMEATARAQDIFAASIITGGISLIVVKRVSELVTSEARPLLDELVLYSEKTRMTLLDMLLIGDGTVPKYAGMAYLSMVDLGELHLRGGA